MGTRNVSMLCWNSCIIKKNNNNPDLKSEGSGSYLTLNSDLTIHGFLILEWLLELS